MNIIACGALAKELLALKQANHWDALKITCLPAHYHQTPQRIPAAVRQAITALRSQNDDDILVAYGDCGTGGQLDTVLEETGVERLPGAHCYEFFAGSPVFHALQEAELGTFYLTDFLAQHFDTYVWRALGLDRKPELLPLYFKHYKKLIYLAQTESSEFQQKAREHAERLGLDYSYRYTGYGEMGTTLDELMPKVVMSTNAPTKPLDHHPSSVTHASTVNATERTACRN